MSKTIYCVAEEGLPFKRTEEWLYENIFRLDGIKTFATKEEAYRYLKKRNRIELLEALDKLQLTNKR